MTAADVAAAPAAPALPAAHPAVPRSPAEIVALVAAIVPTAVMVGRAAAVGWVPLFDAGYFAVRSRDVLTEHNPLVGAWSMGSRGAGVWVNNLGPLQLDLLAPFTKLDPYWGTALGVGATDVAAVVGVWLVARRLFGPAGVIGAMAATVLLQLDMGSLMLIEARQQLALVLPMWCTLWLATAVAHGVRRAAPWLVVAASLVLQTHFTYAYQTAAVTLAAAAGLVWRFRRRLGELAVTAAMSVTVALLCWLPTLWDQVAGSGNLGNVLRRESGTQRPVGWSRGLRLLAETGFVPPWFVPGSMGDMLREGSRPSLPAAVAALVVWAGLLVAVLLAARRVGSPRSTMAAVALVVLVASADAAAEIPPTEQFGIIAQNYYWAWPVGVFVATPIVGHAGAWLLRQAAATDTGATARDRAAWLATVALGAATIPLYWPTNQLPETRHEWSIAHQQARALLDDFGAALDRYDVGAPVLVDLGAARHVRYTMLAELQERGIDFRFSPGSTNISRFGDGRCDDGTAAWLLTLRQGTGAIDMTSAGVLLASVAGLTDAQAERSRELADRFGELLRDGTVVVDGGAVEAMGGEVPPLVERVRVTDDLSARTLATFLHDWAYFGAVRVDGDDADRVHEELEEWARLERAAADDRMAIYLTRIEPSGVDDCDRIPPGYDYGLPIDD